MMHFLEDTRESTSFSAVTESSNLPTIDIPVQRIDDAVTHEGPWFLFKTDTQGFELGVLKGAHDVLSSGKVFILMIEFSFGLLHQAGTDPLDLLDFIYELGYVCTYMAYHTRMSSDASKSIYQVVNYDPYFHDGTNSISFEDFVESLRVVKTHGSAGVSGWTDLLCWLS